jgi:squalene synthase HpnC
MPVDHYENFPVASLLLPARLRRPVEIIYAFARSADDFADEGDFPDSERLGRLGGYVTELDRIGRGEASRLPLFHQVAEIISRHALPISLFYDLLDAFTQDVTKKRYADFREVLDYCRRSANPIGRLLLHLYNAATPLNLTHSDSICSALQLINFWQDIEADYARNRIYLPRDEMTAQGITAADIASRNFSPDWSMLMQFQCQRARAMLENGRPLTRALPGRIGVELRLVVAGGGRILDKIDAVRGDVFRHRPVLTRWDWLALAPGALIA